MAAYRNKEELEANLKAAGCGEELIGHFFAEMEKNNFCQAMKLLAEHRKNLLEQFHGCKCCIDCLDYLVFQMEKDRAEKGKTTRCCASPDGEKQKKTANCCPQNGKEQKNNEGK